MILFILFLEIFFINFVLSIDNILVFAGVTAKLKDKQKKQVVFFGGLFAIFTRIAFIIMIYFAFQALSNFSILVSIFTLSAGILLFKVGLDLTNAKEHSKKEKKHTTKVFIALLEVIFIDILLSFDNAVAIAALVNNHSDEKTAILLVLISIAIFLSFPFLVFGSSSLAKYIEKNKVVNYIAMFVLILLGIELLFSTQLLDQYVLSVLTDKWPEWTKRTYKIILALLVTMDKFFYDKIKDRKEPRIKIKTYRE